jgi:hypothetical protein
VNWHGGEPIIQLRWRIRKSRRKRLAAVKDFNLNAPDWRGEAVSFGHLWTMTKGRRTATCSLWNHPTRRVELRCFVDGDLVQSQADNDGLALLDLAQEWKKQFQEKGWQS